MYDHVEHKDGINTRHLSVLEPHLFASLVRAGIARKEKCTDLQTFSLHVEYLVRELSSMKKNYGETLSGNPPVGSVPHLKQVKIASSNERICC